MDDIKPPEEGAPPPPKTGPGGARPGAGRPPGSKNRPKGGEEWSVPAGVIGATLKGVYASIGQLTGVPDAWDLNDATVKSLDDLGIIIVRKYAPLLMDEHPELWAFGIILGVSVSTSVIQTVAVKQQRKAAAREHTVLEGEVIR